MNQNLSLKEVLNPLKREFYKVWRKSSILSLESFKNYNKSFSNYNKKKRFFKSIWRYLLILFINSYNRYSIDFYNKFNIWLSLDVSFTLSWLNSISLNNKLVLFSRKFYNNRSFFVSLFFYNFFSFAKSSFKLFFQITTQSLINPVINFVSFFNPIFIDLFVTKFSLFNNEKSLNYNLKFIKLIIII